jgi:hypothetical protein
MGGVEVRRKPLKKRHRDALLGGPGTAIPGGPGTAIPGGPADAVED